MLLYNISNTTLWTVIGFLIVTLALGLYAGKGVKNIRDYALGGKSFSTFTLTLTLLATKIGGGTILGFTNKVYFLGIISVIASIAICIRYLIIAFLIAPKLVKFKNCITSGDIMEVLYGEKVKILCGISTIFLSIGMSILQMDMLGKATQSLMGIKYVYGLLFGGVILILYSAFGGIKSVTYTDIFQFLFFFIIIPMMAMICLKHIGGYKTLFLNIPESYFKIFSHKKFFFYLAYFLMLGMIPDMIIDPPVLQRLLMTKNKEQLKYQLLITGLLESLFKFTIILIGLSAVLLLPKLNTSQIFPEIVHKILSSKQQTLVIIAVLATIMSTLDSRLLSSGIFFSNDVIKPIFKFKNLKFNDLFSARLFTILFGIISLTICFFLKSFDIFEMIFWASKASSLLVFPSIIGVLGLKTDKKSLFFGILVGLSFLLLCDYFLPKTLKQLSIPIGILLNGLVYLITHIIQNKGIAWVERSGSSKLENESDEKIKIWIPYPKVIIKKLVTLIPTPKKIHNYSKFQVMKNGAENILFGIYCCINFTLPYFFWDNDDPYKYNLMTNLRFVGGIMAGLLIVKDEWKKFLKPYFPLYWHATLVYCLPFITTVMFLFSNGSLLWLIQITVSIFFLIMLVAGEVFLILAPLGIFLGLVFFKFFVGPINISSLGFDINYHLIYAFFFPTIIGLLFAYKKKIFNKEISNIGINLGLSLCHEIRNTLAAMTYTDMARRKLNKLKEMASLESKNGKEILIIDKNSFDSIYNDVDTALGLNKDSVKVTKTFENLFLEYKRSNVSLQVDSIQEIVNDSLKQLHFLPNQLEKIKLDLREDFFIQLPKAQFAFVLSNIIRNAFKHGNSSIIEIRSENNKLIIKDNGIGIPDSDIDDIFKMHYTTGKKGESSGIGLWFSNIVINSFDAEMSCISQQGEDSFTEFIIQFPEIDPDKIYEYQIHKKLKK